MSGYATGGGRWADVVWPPLSVSVGAIRAAERNPKTTFGVGMAGFSFAALLWTQREVVSQLCDWAWDQLRPPQLDSVDAVVTDILNGEGPHYLLPGKMGPIQVSEANALRSFRTQKFRVVSFCVSSQSLPAAVAMLGAIQPALCGLQGLAAGQSQEIEESGEGVYGWVASSGSDPILFRKERFELIRGDSRYLCKEKGAHSVSLGLLRDKRTKKVLLALNTHFSSEDARLRQAEAEALVQFLGVLPSDLPVVFMGDLETYPPRLDQDLPAYDGEALLRRMRGAKLEDSREVCKIGKLGPEGTLAYLDGEFVATDHIMVGGGAQVLTQGHENGKVSGRYPSSHFPVIADLVLPAEQAECLEEVVEGALQSR